MLSLSDPIWPRFQANYTDGAGVAGLLRRAESGEPPDSWYDDLFQELCHQYTVSQAAYPAAPHLVRLANAHPDLRADLMILLGACYAYAQSAPPVSLPAHIVEEWRLTAERAVTLIAALLTEPQTDQIELRYLLASLAAVKGHPGLAVSIEALDVDPGLDDDHLLKDEY
jgi:hypothetical protein